MDTQNNTNVPNSPAPKPSDSSNNMLMGILSYLGILVVIPLVSAGDNQFVKFHAKQGLILFICEIIGWFIIAIPFFGWFLSPLIELAAVILLIIGIINVANNQMKELPVIGHLAAHLKF